MYEEEESEKRWVGGSDVLTPSCLLSECELVTHSPWLSSGDLLATAGVALD